MSLPFLLDEHVPHALQRILIRRDPTIRVWIMGGPSAPPVGSPDPDLLDWCETNDVILVTNNRKSMPGHLAAHLAGGRHVPGILVLDPTLPLALTAADLLLISGASFADEYRDVITFLPVSF